MISTGTRGGGGERNVALEQLQSYIRPSWICLSPLACVQPARISACGYPSPQLCHAFQPPGLLPFPGSVDTPFIPHVLRLMV